MPVNAYDLITIRNYYATYTTAYGGYGMSGYLGQRYYNDGSGPKTFPGSSLGLLSFYGTSPVDEWTPPPPPGGGGGK